MLKPLEDRIIIKTEGDKEQVSSSGLIIQSAKEVKNTGEVIAIGPGRTLPSGIQLDPDVAVGDKVLFNPLATQTLEHDGQEYLVVFSRDILAVLESTGE
jgi:chaperonin GroES